MSSEMASMRDKRRQRLIHKLSSINWQEKKPRFKVLTKTDICLKTRSRKKMMKSEPSKMLKNQLFVTNRPIIPRLNKN